MSPAEAEARAAVHGDDCAEPCPGCLAADLRAVREAAAGVLTRRAKVLRDEGNRGVAIELDRMAQRIMKGAG